MEIVDKIYDSVMDAVVRACEPDEDWLRSNRQECVEARALLIWWLFKMGLNRRQIVIKTGLKKSAVVKHINTYDDKKKCSRILVIMHSQVERELSTNL